MRPVTNRRHQHSSCAFSIIKYFLLMMSFSLFAGAQCVSSSSSPQISLSQTYFAPGQSYNVSLNDPTGSFVPYTPPSGFLPATAYVITAANEQAGNYTSEDPNITVTLPVYVSPTQLTLTITVSGAAPIELNDAWTFLCVGHTFYANPGTVAITPCATVATPTISAIQQNTWFAGQSSNITITGSGFILPSNTNGCSSTQVEINAPGDTVSQSNIVVVSPTQITLTVSPLSADPAETATITVSNYTYNSPYYAYSGAQTAQILPVPVIFMGGTTISGTTSQQGATVGQNISLTTTPASLPSGYSIAQSKWMVGGTNIGGYTVTPPTLNAPTVSSASVASTILNNTSLQTYWTAQGSKIPVTYQYCVNTSAGLQCSSIATGYFNVAGPTGVSVTTSGMMFNADLVPPETLEWTLDFTGKATSPTGTAGAYSWVQIVSSVTDTETFSSGTSKTCSGGPALDTSYPYDSGLTAADTATDPLSQPNETGANDTRSFQMYLMWNPGIDTKSIPVALGSVVWKAVGTTTFNATTKTWGKESGSTTANAFTTSTTEPTWTSAITGVSLAANCH